MEKVALLCVLMAIISVLAEMSPAPKPSSRPDAPGVRRPVMPS